MERARSMASRRPSCTLVGAGDARPRYGAGLHLAVAFVVASTARHGERHDPSARRDERARAVAPRDPGHVDVCRAVSRAGARRAVAWVAVVADPLDRRLQRARGPGAGMA